MSKTSILKFAFDTIHYSGAAKALSPFWGGQGVIFCLHHVKPGGGLQKGFAPNSNLEVTPEFLEKIIALAKRKGYDLLSLDAAADRLLSGQTERRFAVFTLDDGYRDNLLHAMPVFKKYACPFTVYVAPKIVDGSCELWWRGLEAIIAKADRLDLGIGEFSFSGSTATVAEKWSAWQCLAPRLQAMPEYEQRDWMRTAANDHGVNLVDICKTAAMTWDEIRNMNADPLATIGAHTMNHYNLMKLPGGDSRREMIQSRETIEAELQEPVRHFAYPYGNRDAASRREFRLAEEAGFRTSVVTRLGTVQPRYARHMQALPRIMVSGRYQQIRYIETLMSGVPGRLANGLRGLNVT